MKSSSAISALALLSCATAAPLTKRQAVTDVDILQFALTLEHLEAAFYRDALMQMPESMFLDAGYSAQYYSNLKYIAADEKTHVTALASALQEAGATPVEPCTYSFPYTDVNSFIGLSAVLEGVGTSAYQGAAPAVSSKEYLAVAGSILSVEALHTSMQRYVLNQVPMANPFYTALVPNGAFTLAAAFIKACPPNNPPLPFKAFDTLTNVQGVPAAPGIPFEFSTEAALPASFFVTFVSGLTTTSVPATVSGSTFMAVIPETAQGQIYAFATSSSVDAISDSVVIAGPAIVEVTPPAPQF